MLPLFHGGAAFLKMGDDEMDGKYTEVFPVNSSSEMKIIKNGKLINAEDESSLIEIVKKWKPFDSLLIAVSGNKHFLPILNIERFRSRAHKTAIDRSNVGLRIILLAMLISIAMAYIFNKPKMWILAETFFGLGIFLLIDHIIIIRNIFALNERENYIFFIRKFSLSYMIFWAAFMLIIGWVQVFIGYGQQDPDYCLLIYGAVFKSLNKGEYWRLITGAFIHGSIVHWFSNFVMLVAAAGIAGAISRINAFFAFLLGCVAGNLASWWCSPWTHADACQGASAGIMAIMGFCIIQCIKNPNSFPRLFSWTLSYFVVLNIYLSYVNNPQVSNEAHFAGVLAGVIWGVVVSGGALVSYDRLSKEVLIN
ncbi:rhomboid family intramembrane serine protease [Duganella caerulea]|uniref:rhomboid family intramembrane serine protease n=1 Tax=Duganella caerulea TaxID=2885762 RepID=UPI004037ED90